MANETQAALWTDTLGPLWVAGEERANAVAGEHGRRAMAAAQVRAGERILDVGCGLGHTTLELARLAGPTGAVTGLDISSLFVGIANERAANSGLDNVAFVLGDAQIDRLEEADVVFSECGVMFFEDPVAAFANMRGALRAGGRLAFCCWQSPFVNPWMSTPTMAAASVLGMPEFPAPGQPGPFAFAEPDHVRTILDGAGFAGITIESSEVVAEVTLDVADFGQYLGFSPLRLVYEASDAQTRGKAETAVREAMAQYVTGDHMHVPSASWIVSASA